MKIKPEHLDELRTTFRAAKEQIINHRSFLISPENPKPPKDLNVRLRWDALWRLKGARWVSDTLSYLNDEHIDSALRTVMKDLAI